MERRMTDPQTRDRGVKITSIELHEFEYEVRDFGTLETSEVYEPGTRRRRTSHGVKVHTDAGITGEYVSTFTVIEPATLGWVAGLVLGQNALERERLYDEVKRATRHVGRLGIAPLDIALWDIAGKYYSAPVYELLGGRRKRLRVYASTAFADVHGGLDSPEAFADFAERCQQRGYRGFKIHPWWHAPIEREVALVHAVGRRVGGKMDLMLDPACAYDTFGDAVKVGHACDEEGFFWLEDPLQDGGVTHLAHRKLRELIQTPLLQGEHVRCFEERLNLVMAEATDFIRGDVRVDGITGTMKLAHAAESLGLDIEIHLGDPPTRHCLAAIRNSNYYEWGLVHPKLERRSDPIYADGYMDGDFDGIDAEGTVGVPDGPGLGVRYDWEYIAKHTVDSRTYS
jgi:L-alanine-DL-glutamate epimerase-like enolase superfamily enzyme